MSTRTDIMSSGVGAVIAGTIAWPPQGVRRASSRRSTIGETLRLPTRHALRSLASAERRESVEPLRPGSVIPGTRLRVRGRLGEGATSVVYRGEHIDLQRPLAIKVLSAISPDPDARGRFLAEARLTSELESPFVVDVVDFGTLEDGRLYYAMELLAGRTLAAIIERGPVSPARAIAMLRMACKGLEAAHEAGIVHRDIKPANLMVVRRRGRERLVVVDFGIATNAGCCPDRTAGTPHYMAPEQIAGGVVDARTDLYALGCCAYEMLTGEEFAFGETTAAVLARHLDNERPPFPNVAEVPRALRRVVERCLAVDPADRFASIAELEAALCEVQVAAGFRCATDYLEPPAVEGARRRRIAMALAKPQRLSRARGIAIAWAGLISVLAIAVGATQSSLAAPDEGCVRPDLESMAAAECVDPKLVELAANGEVAATVPPSTPAEPRAREPRRAAPEIAPPESKATPVLATESKATPVLAAVAVDTPKPPPPRAARSSKKPAATWRETSKSRRLVRQAARTLRSGRRDEARRLLERAINVDAGNAGAYGVLSDVYFEQGRHERALHYARMAVRRDPSDTRHRIRLGDAYYRVERTDAALVHYRKAAEKGSFVAAQRLKHLSSR